MGCAELDAERSVAALARSSGALRAALARVAHALVARRAWERLGYARLSDYAAERLGQSARTVQDWALVGRKLAHHALLERALASGEIPWTKIRLLARLRFGAEIEAWLPRARTLTAAALAREVRRCDTRSIEAGHAEVDPDDDRPIRGVSIRCTPRVRRKWGYVCGLARRVAGRSIGGTGELAEMIAAEVLSALPVEEVARLPAIDEGDAPNPDPPWLDDALAGAPSQPPVAHRLEALVDGAADAEAPDLDRRLRALLALERRHEALLGPRVLELWRSGIPRRLGFARIEAWARERLGMDGRKARDLLSIERAAAQWGGLDRAYRAGEISWVAARTLVPLAVMDGLDRFSSAWAAHARQVTVRRLRDDVERALELAHAEPETFALTGGVPAGDDAASVAEIGADAIAPDRAARTRLPAPSLVPANMDSPAEIALVVIGGPRAQVRLFEAVLNTVRRRLPARDGRQATAGEALEAMLDHVVAAWDQEPGRGRAIFERDGWRCAVPGCTSMRNLHEHHIAFRSRGGSNDRANRIALCAWHHLRGVHARRIRIEGQAPDALRFHLPLERFASGDRRL
jgi:hypothetical protein